MPPRLWDASIRSNASACRASQPTLEYGIETSQKGGAKKHTQADGLLGTTKNEGC